ncbi:MAG: gliding motility-associated C-terminal domain-containing protein [Saprospiraceae bacterium]|nr:gliding motility-associated C-terminal domain-containing protein [Saprospiraceae bacterium]
MTSFPPEICDNAIDDDLDGRIDLHDPDCSCSTLEPTSLIPNHSFEEQECCPMSHSRVDCLQGWIRASQTTPDYFHSCDWTGAGALDIPQTLPDGEGFIGIIDGSFSSDPNPNWKEYVGICLEDTLQIDTLYRLQLHVGFLSQRTSPSTDIVIFGTADCANLPFGLGDATFGCPSNGPGWIRLGSVSVAGENEWKQVEILFRSNNNIAAVVIGPDCYQRSLENDPYYLIDKLILAKDQNFNVDIVANDHPCSPSFELSIPPQLGYRYQGYKDGIAVVGATSRTLTSLPGAGEYQVRIENELGCKLSETFQHAPPSFYSQTIQTICEGTAVHFNGQILQTAGIFWDTLTATNQCDSIVELNLEVAPHEEKEISAKIFPPETYQIGSFSFSTPGNYVQNLISSTGCDSTIYLELDYFRLYTPNAFSPNDDGLNDIFTFGCSPDVKSIEALIVFDRWGNIVYEGESLSCQNGWNGQVNGKPALAGVYVYTSTILFTDDKVRQLDGSFMLVR